MTSRDFCYWLQGYFELQENAPIPIGTVVSSNAFLQLDAKQVDCVKRHLALVFKHEIDPSMGPLSTQQALDKLHNTVPFEPRPAWMAGGGGLGPAPHDGEPKARC